MQKGFLFSRCSWCPCCGRCLRCGWCPCCSWCRCCGCGFLAFSAWPLDGGFQSTCSRTVAAVVVRTTITHLPAPADALAVGTRLEYVAAPCAAVGKSSSHTAKHIQAQQDNQQLAPGPDVHCPHALMWRRRWAAGGIGPFASSFLDPKPCEIGRAHV